MPFIITEPVRTVNASDFTGSFMPIGDPLASDVAIVKVYNQTNEPVLFSFDGVNAAELIDIGMTFKINGLLGGQTIEAGTQFYVSGYPSFFNYGAVYLAVYRG